MAWRKSKIVLLLFLFLLAGIDAPCQNFEEDDWEEVVKELDYGDVEKRKEEKEKDDVAVPNRDHFKMPELGDTGKAIVLGAFIILLVFLITKLLHNQNLKGKIKADQPLSFSLEELEENIHDNDLSHFLKLALKEKNYRVALRIQYLIAIKKLSDLKWITWKKDKTNKDYLNELQGKEQHESFRKLTWLFNIVWYGDVPLSRKEYEQIKPDFEGFIAQLNLQIPEGEQD